MWINAIWLLLGLGLILWGADRLTDGAGALAKRWGMSDLTIGLTVVAFGTSAPELVVSVVSAISGNAGLAIGNVVGSNIFNILVIIGITAIVRPIRVERNILTKDIPLVAVSSLALLAMGNGSLLDGASSSVLTRADGFVLLLFFAIFMRHTFSASHDGMEGTDMGPSGGRDVSGEPALWKAILFVVIGLGCLIFGGDRFVAGASGLALAWGVPDAVIGLTIVAAGTSFPELAASVAAALKGRPGIAVGNVIGSCIFNVFFVLGVSASIKPLPFGKIGNFDLLTLCLASIMFFAFGWWIKQRTVTRGEGVLMVACYVGYIAYLITLL